MTNTIIKVKMGHTFAKQCNEMFKKYGKDVFYEWRTATGKVFQDAAYSEGLSFDYKWLKMTPNAVQKSFMKDPNKLYRFVLVGNNLRSYSRGTLKHAKMVFYLSEYDLMKKSKKGKTKLKGALIRKPVICKKCGTDMMPFYDKYFPVKSIWECEECGHTRRFTREERDNYLYHGGGNLYWEYD